MKRKHSFWSVAFLLSSPFVLVNFFSFFAGRDSPNRAWRAQLAAMRPAGPHDVRLLEAARANDIIELRKLIRNGADVNCRDRTRFQSCSGEGGRTLRTPLMLAVIPRGVPGAPSPFADTNMVRFLISAGASVNDQDSNGDTALIWAASRGDLPVCKLLIASGAQTNCTNRQGDSPLSRAASNGHMPVVQLLLAAGAQVNQKRRSAALAEAAYRGHRDIVVLLLERGAKVDDPGGYSPLHRAMFRNNSEIAEVLIKHGADVNARMNRTDTTPLHQAAEYGRTQIIRLLLQNGADKDSRNNEGETALDIAKQYGLGRSYIIENEAERAERKRLLAQTRDEMCRLLTAKT